VNEGDTTRVAGVPWRQKPEPLGLGLRQRCCSGECG